MTTFAFFALAVLLVLWIMSTDADEGVDLGVLLGVVADEGRDDG